MAAARARRVSSLATWTSIANRKSDFAPLEHVADIRQWGFMIGIELRQNPRQKQPYATRERVGMRVIKEARKHGVMIRPLGDIIVLMPPLSITHEELATLLDVVRDAIITVTEQT
jgi:adenosylmethionine-8-amino-7-oxononanoate aminotransferase